MKTGGVHRCWNHLSDQMNITNFDGDKDSKNSTWIFFDKFEKAAAENYSKPGRSRPLAARLAYDEYKATLIASLDFTGAR